MVIIHAFLRTIRKVDYVMADSSTDAYSRPRFASAVSLFEAVGDADRWIPRAQREIEARFPDLVAGETCVPNNERPGNIRCFDLVFYERGEPPWSRRQK